MKGGSLLELQDSYTIIKGKVSGGLEGALAMLPIADLITGMQKCQCIQG